MKKIFLIFFFFFSIYQISYSQFLSGPKGSIHAYTAHYGDKDVQDIYNPKINIGYKAGISSIFPLSDHFSLGWDVLFSRRGRNVKMGESQWRLEEIHNFLEFPVLLNIKFDTRTYELGPFKRLGPFTGYFGIGPNMSYWFGGKGYLNTGGIGNNYKLQFSEFGGDFETLYILDANRFQWGMDLALGFFSPMSNNSQLLTEFRLTLGHTYMGGEESTYMPILGFEDNLEANYRLLSLSFGYLFYLDPGQLLKGKSTKGQKIKAEKIGGPKKKRTNTNKKTSKRKTSNKKPKNINKKKTR
ncbi:hypothetical protein ACFLU5_08250 [Bacteroidota bacterium]